MIKSLFAGPEFLTKVLPVAKLDTEFQFEQCQLIFETINQIQNVKALAILETVNQRFFRTFNAISNKPRLTKDNVFLFHDCVHVIKCIRKN